MMKRIIAFEDFSAHHSGSVLAKTLRNVFLNFHLENKIMSITLDNASNNTSAIGKLKLKYDLLMEGKFYHSRCVAHIINLCVQDDLAVPTINNINESFKTMLKDVFRSGGKNHQRYVRICKQAGKPCLSPHWDVPTRWNSIIWGWGVFIEASHRNQVTSLLRRLKEHTNKKAKSDPSLSSEYERYVHSDFVARLQITEFETFDVLGFWNAKETMFLVLSRMAMDILSVQDTSVASESAFSTSGRVLSIRRTRLTPASLEMCMCLKDHLDAQERKHDKSTIETPVNFEEEILDAGVRANEAIPLFDEEIALDATSNEYSMSGPGSGGEEAEANYGYDVYHDDY
nr:zinc finger BED domain-containing protein RICESLEEPER 2-like [Tanacetum cinerariifolium]